MNEIKIPGWVDLQVNGYKGVNFSDPKLSIEDIISVSRELFKLGIVAYCPTIISSPLEVYKRNLPLFTEAIKQTEGAEILGLHLEGPFINPEEGIRGIHLREHTLPPAIDLFEKIFEWSEGAISLITLAPEIQGSIQLIEHIAYTSDIIISIGHSMANEEQITAAVKAGLKAATHVGNGIPAYIPRHHNPIWPILAENKISGLFITDGFHLPPEMIKVCIKAKSVEKFIVTSDLMQFAGLNPGIYAFCNKNVILEKNGYLHEENSEMLAGSTKSMMDCMNFLASIINIPENDYYKVGFENPLKLLNKKLKQTYKSQIGFNNYRFDITHE